jgi:NAD+ kinase
VVPEFLGWVSLLGVKYVADEALRDILQDKPQSYFPRNEIAQNCNVVLSFGGDGTMLSTVRAVGAVETPILGVNLGGLGYLAEISPEELKGSFRDFLAGRYTIENRMLLEAMVSNGVEINVYHALNDVVVEKGVSTRITKLRTTIQGEYFNTYHADGLIISTPTGSTGYSLSAGGPILEPTMQGIIVNPICPHTLAHRPVVISADKVIEIETDPKMPEHIFACDGFSEQVLTPGAKIRVQKSSRVVKLVNMKGKYFYKILREKLKWGT